ncbi:hypothetical protein JGH11_05435 [Dysgonomonas sp. Marseille-P4677]|uniref:hypothetical protein n=1 Tax=Dysgonomonas sp. Marseille-P4677 TaxID=2364790 RepID=UPI00191183C1|nr:hypothetical protein [Dysgonomonas sp. Marseille-P4677]MBK5720306.1 hypothetical protein [Dysgonomonas sp. Marseille-P4677]
MKKINIILFLLLLPFVCSAQFIGIGAQYADAKDKGNDFQFAANISFPVWHKKNALNSFIASGVDYTGGSSPVAGLNIKPIQLTSYLSESLFDNNKATILVGCDAGYLFNFRHGKDGIVITPNIYLDYKFFFIKTGYDFNVTGNEQQFFVRAGFCFGMGSIKSYAKTTIR